MTTHGYARDGKKTAEYTAWRNMIERCESSARWDFRYYGGRGITVCPEWRSSFERFLAYVGPRPTPSHSLDRFPDSNGQYCPGNVRWATKAEQARNRRLCSQCGKLDAAKVLDIRGRIARGDRTVDIARDYSVTKAMISHIKYGRAWADVT